MSAPHIALIACANGLGHVRRMCALSLALSARGARPVLFAPAEKVGRLAEAYGFSAGAVQAFSSRTQRRDWLVGAGPDWIADLPDVSAFDAVVCDNMIEILECRPDAWLSGSFFWHRALTGFPTGRATRAEVLLERIRPRMIATRLFAADYLAERTRLTAVGLYALGPTHMHAAGQDLLIACGTGGHVEAETSDLLRAIAAGPRPVPGIVWVEPDLHRPDMPVWMQPAGFTTQMYGQLLAAVIRPGIGTVTDALLAGVRLFTFHEAGNDEMRVNAARIVAAGLGEDGATSPLLAWQAALRYHDDRAAQANHRAAAAALGRNGAAEAADAILRDLTVVNLVVPE